ncbi:hypothetical protein F4802DRAFT_31320 [Xylaria palmicola]|nr:hypothetical protein F4802DRAFT_31320 [Xylaria palmicola]
MPVCRRGILLSVRLLQPVAIRLPTCIGCPTPELAYPGPPQRDQRVHGLSRYGAQVPTYRNSRYGASCCEEVGTCRCLSSLSALSALSERAPPSSPPSPLLPTLQHHLTTPGSTPHPAVPAGSLNHFIFHNQQSTITATTSASCLLLPTHSCCKDPASSLFV